MCNEIKAITEANVKTSNVHKQITYADVQVQVQVGVVAFMSSSKAHLSAHSGPL